MATLKKISSILTTAIVAVVVVLAVALVGVRLVGLDVYTVLSGSMEPTYKTGSVIWVKPCDPEDVRVGDPITFVLDEDLTVATHRVVNVNEKDGEFTTKGDANQDVDGAPVLFENLIGKPVFSVPALGYFVAYVQSPSGRYVALAVGAVILMLMFLPTLLAKDPKDGKGKNAKGSGRHTQIPSGYSQTYQARSAQTVRPVSVGQGRHARPAKRNDRRTF